jgi:PAS domain S-box-containing protein
VTTTAILIVEDEQIISKAIEKRLKRLGYAVAGVAHTGNEAVEKAVELRPDLILMDINLGSGIDGVEAAGLIRQRMDAPVVFLTAHSDEATLQRAKITEPHGYVLKPYEDSDLRTAIEIGMYKHRMDRRLRENEQWLAATLGSIGDGVIATDEVGRVRFMNALAERLTGWTQADALGLGVTEVFRIVGEKTREPVPNPVLEALKKGEPVTLVAGTLLIAKGGSERPIDDSAAPIRDVNGNVSGVVLVFRDDSERRRLEEHLRQAQKMEAVGRLAGGIAHDFNNLMTVVNGYSQLLRDNGDLTPADRGQYLDLIRDAGQRAAGLTQQILAFSRKQVLVPTVLSLNACVRDIGLMVRRLIGEHITLVTETAPDLGPVKADPTQVGQVLLNLAVNARDSMPTGGRLEVSTANVALDERVTRDHPDVPPGVYAMLSVRDTGMGIPPDVLAHVFEPFFTTKGGGQGTGLGLATVYWIVKQSGGHIEVESTVGAGTTFRVYLPLVEEPLPTRPDTGTGEALGGTETVLLVEDEDSVRQMTKLILERHGYTVLEASDGEMGIQASRDHAGTIHLLLCDLVMPNLSGRELAEAVVAARPGVRVLFMSGYTEDILVHQGVESSAADFLHKPFTLDSLGRMVREVLDRCRGVVDCNGSAIVNTPLLDQENRRRIYTDCPITSR